MKLNKTNYFTNRNKYLSNSKLKDWEKDIHFFYRKHILCEIENKPTVAMQRGKAVDVWLTKSEKDFREEFVAVSKRNLLNPPKGYTELSITEYKKVEDICRKIELQTAYKQLRGFSSQKILQWDSPTGLFDGICGIPDWFKISKDGKSCIIVDLKTSESVEWRKYHWHCINLCYYRQQAMYQKLLGLLYPDIDNFVSRHLVVEVDKDEIYRIALFNLDQNTIVNEIAIVNHYLNDIGQEQKFAQQDERWEDAILIGGKSCDI